MYYRLLLFCWASISVDVAGTEGKGIVHQSGIYEMPFICFFQQGSEERNMTVATSDHVPSTIFIQDEHL